MGYEAAVENWNQIKITSLDGLKQDLLDAAIRYARIRVDWLMANAEKRRSLDHDRAVSHTALIAACDILARNMAKNGEDASWRKLLGDDRKNIGDFACFLHCRLGISAR